MADNQEILDLLTRIDRVSSIGDESEANLSLAQFESWTLFDRCRSLLGAIHLLLSHSFPHER
jgi:hypothetical protein